MAVKQAVISPSALSLLYPSEGIAGYRREKFLTDLVNEAARDIRGCLEQGAHCVQIDFTEGRLAVKLDPTGQLLSSFIALINRVLGHSLRRNENVLGFIPAREEIAIRRTAPTLITQDYYLPFSNNPENAPSIRLACELHVKVADV